MPTDIKIVRHHPSASFTLFNDGHFDLSEFLADVINHFKSETSRLLLIYNHLLLGVSFHGTGFQYRDGSEFALVDHPINIYGECKVITTIERLYDFCDYLLDYFKTKVDYVSEALDVSYLLMDSVKVSVDYQNQSSV